MFKNNLKNQIINLQRFFIFFTIFSFFFLWDFKLIKIEVFFFVIAPLALIVFNYKYNKQHIFFFLVLVSFFIFLLFFNLLGYNFDFATVPKIKIIKLVALMIVSIFCFFSYKEIIKQIKLLVLLFAFLYFSLNIFDLLTNLDKYSFYDLNIFENLMCHYRDGLFRKNILFTENSHFGMIGVSITFFLFYLSSIEKNKLLKVLYLILILSFLFNISTTYLAGFIYSSGAIIISCFKDMNKQFLISIILFSLFSLSMLLSDPSCAKRFLDIKNTNKAMTDLKEKIFKLDDASNEISHKTIEQAGALGVEIFPESPLSEILYKYVQIAISIKAELDELNVKILNAEDAAIKKKYQKKYRKKNKLYKDVEKIIKHIDNNRLEIVVNNLSMNTTTQVYIRSLYIAKESLFNRFYGWGFENYDQANNAYRYKIPTINPSLINYNIQDASNNFVKIIVEFGIFGIFLLLYLVKISLNNNIEPAIKYFFVPMVVTQLIRGAGYFNGGFILAIIILFLLDIYSSKEKGALINIGE